MEVYKYGTYRSIDPSFLVLGHLDDMMMPTIRPENAEDNCGSHDQSNNEEGPENPVSNSSHNQQQQQPPVVIGSSSASSSSCHNHLISPSPYFTIQHGSKGRGLFATQDIAPNTLLHVAPCLAFSQQSYQDHLQYTLLAHYVFQHKPSDSLLLALGYGSLFNHSKQPNVSYRIAIVPTTGRSMTNNNEQTKGGGGGYDYSIHYSSSPYKTIVAGDELCITYGTNSNLWFDDASSDSDNNNNNDESSSSSEHCQDFLGRIQINEDEDKA
jgi:hypothetical protein